MNDIRQSPQYANYLSKTGWIVERIKETNYFIKKFPLIGSALKIQRLGEIDIKTINKLAKKYRAFQIIVEPLNKNDELIILKNGFKKSKSPYLPSKTLRLNLSLPTNRLIGNMKKDARLALRKTNCHELCSINTKIEDFRNAWKKAVGLKHYVSNLTSFQSLKDSFKENCVLYSCSNTLTHQVVAGAVFLLADKTVYYWKAFTNEEGRKSLAQYRIVWQGILWARSRGAKIFDFEGIYDDRFPDKSWIGFTHFKKSFGGYEVEYPGCFVKTRIPLFF
jgi:hypothetical protein